jgi:PGF-pre-PGF domain-containing protein
VTDVAGNSASATASYEVKPRSSGSSTAGGTATPVSATIKTQSFTKITPGVAEIVKNFDAGVGLKEIQISVNNEAQNVKITVTKYDGKPAEVSVSKTGKVYQYLQIKEQNLGSKLSKATVTAKVEKAWVSSNGLMKEDVAVSKFDEVNKKWNELSTTYSSEDDTYYYYSADVNSFSYFALGEKTVLVDGEEVGVSEEAEQRAGIPMWVWIVVGLVVLAIVAGVVWKKRE